MSPLPIEQQRDLLRAHVRAGRDAILPFVLLDQLEPIEILPEGGPRTRGQKLAIAISIAGNLLFLGFFKYFNFTVGTFNDAASALGLGQYRWSDPIHVLLPLGISFSVFQSMSYAIQKFIDALDRLDHFARSEHRHIELIEPDAAKEAIRLDARQGIINARQRSPLWVNSASASMPGFPR